MKPRKWTDAERVFVTNGNAAGLDDAVMGEALGRTAGSVASYRQYMGIGTKRRLQFSTEAQPTPGKPKGLCPRQVLWAKLNPGDRQADLITSLHLGKRVGQGYGPRV